MKKYRIIERINGYGTIRYALQKKSIFGFWYNPNSLKRPRWYMKKGWYDSLEVVEKEFRAKTTPTKFTVIKTTERSKPIER